MPGGIGSAGSEQLGEVWAARPPPGPHPALSATGCQLAFVHSFNPVRICLILTLLKQLFIPGWSMVLDGAMVTSNNSEETTDDPLGIQGEGVLIGYGSSARFVTAHHCQYDSFSAKPQPSQSYWL